MKRVTQPGLIALAALVPCGIALGDGPSRPEPSKAVVRRPDGKPLAGARVYRGTPRDSIDVDDDEVQDGTRRQRVPRTAGDGSFALPKLDGPYLILVMDDDAYAIATKDELLASPTLMARPFARVKGTLRIGGRPGAGRRVVIDGMLQGRSVKGCFVNFQQSAITDGDGAFEFDRVLAMAWMRVGRKELAGTPGRVWSLGELVDVEPGATSFVTIGGKGRPVVGRLVAPESRDIDFTDRCGVRLESDRPDYPYPVRLFRDGFGRGRADIVAWTEAWEKEPEARAHRRALVRTIVELEADGSFRIEDIPPGSYRLAASVNEDDSGRRTGPFAHVSRSFTIPPISGGRSDEPFDLGDLPIRVRKTLAVGDRAPAFEVTTTDGRKRRLSDYRGRHLLLDLGGPWSRFSPHQVGRLAEIRSRYGEDPRLAILSLVLAADSEANREFIAEKRQPWPQAIVGPLSNPVADALGIEDTDVPAAILIGPDGRIACKDGRDDPIEKALARALGGQTP